MKKVLLVFWSLLILVSCDVNDDSDYEYNYDFEFVPVESVDMPTEFKLGNTYTINLTYYRPSTCHDFYDLYYHHDGNQRTVAVINTVYNSNNCESLEDDLIEKSFNFRPLDYQSYIFKFWQGEDENGDDIYLTYEVPVVN